MTELLVKEVFENESEGYIFDEGQTYEPFTDDLGKLFRYMQREYGHCTGKVYIDTDEGAVPIGWHFEKIMHYEDCGACHGEEDDYGRKMKHQTYVRGVWVTFQVEPDEHKVVQGRPLRIDRKEPVS